MRMPAIAAEAMMGPRHHRRQGLSAMSIILTITIVVAVILAITGGLVQSLSFLLWIGIVLAVIAIVAWLIRAISGRNST